jgi:predicted metal-dependent hydrolase
LTAGFALPTRRHIPGSGSTPDRVALEPAKAQTPDRVCDRNWREVPAYLFGIELYAAGYFWEAHEVWEPVWMASAPNSRERLLLAGLIQLANACLKLEMGRHKAALRLVEECLRHLRACARPAAGPLMGIAVEPLIRSILAFQSRIAVPPSGTDETSLAAKRPTLEAASASTGPR